MASTRRKGWSYSAGAWGENRVRAFEKAPGGVIFLEYYERDDEGQPKRKRVSLGHRDRDAAKAKADEAAAALRKTEAPRRAELTIQALFDNYVREVTPLKGESKRGHDERTAEMFTRYFGADRTVRTLNRRDWDGFIRDRRAGRIAPKGGRGGEVGDTVVAYDLKLLRAALRWATQSRDARGGALLERNPLTGLAVPREESPRRPMLTAKQYAKLRRAARRVDALFELALVLAHETGHRIGSIRTLRWSDIDLKSRVVRWRAENDKIGFEHSTPLTPAAAAALTRERARQQAIGDAWVFPSPADPAEPCSRHLVRDWFERGAELTELPKGERLGWHSLRRQFATELKETPLKDLCALGGWKSPQTVLTCYQQPDEATMRRALRQRQSVGAGCAK